MILGNIEKHNGKGLVAFLDILGFSKEIEENWGNSILSHLSELTLNCNTLDEFIMEQVLI